MDADQDVPPEWAGLPPMDALSQYGPLRYNIQVLGGYACEHAFKMEWPEWLSEPQWGSVDSMVLLLPDDYIRVPGHPRGWTNTAAGIASHGWIGLCFTVVPGSAIELPFDVRQTMTRATEIFVDGLRWAPPDWNHWK